MTILETFFILFKGETSDLKKSTQEAKKDVDQLNTALKATDNISGKVGNSFANLVRSASGALAAVVSIGAFVQGVKIAADYSNELYNAARALDVNVETLDAWGLAVKREGGTAQGFQHTLKNVASTFQTTNNEVLKALPQLADLFERIGKFQANRLGAKYGFDEATIRLLSRGRAAVDDIIKSEKELYGVTKENAEAAHKYSVQLDKTKDAVRGLGNTINTTLLPQQEKALSLIERGAEFLNRHNRIVDVSIKGVEVLGAAFGVKLIAGLLKANPVIAGLTLALTALGFAIDDIEVGLNGGDSLSSRFMKWIDGIDTGRFGADKILPPFSRFKGPMPEAKGSSLPQLGAPSGKHFNIEGDPFAVPPVSRVHSSYGGDRINSINIGEIAVNTAATDADGISSAIGSSLRTHIQQAANTLGSDGILA